VIDKICKNCRYWIKEHSYYDYGECSKIEDKLDIYIDAGWSGGIVSNIETDEDFGCVLFESK